jgi:hypothetical protein
MTPNELSRDSVKGASRTTPKSETRFRVNRGWYLSRVGGANFQGWRQHGSMEGNALRGYLVSQNG